MGIVLDGSILLTADDKVSFYEKNQTFLICPYMPHSISAHSSYTLNCLNSITAYTDWHSESKNPFINHLKKQLELYPECKISIEEMEQNAFISKYYFIRSFKAEVGLTPHQLQLQN